MHINSSPQQTSRLSQQLEELSDGTRDSRNEQAGFYAHTTAVLRSIERTYVGEDLPQGIIDTLSSLENSLQALSATLLDSSDLEDLSERFKPCYEQLFAVVRELQENLGINIDQIQREREEARWRDDQQRQERDIDAIEAISICAGAVNPAVKWSTQKRMPNTGLALSIDTSCLARPHRPLARVPASPKHQSLPVKLPVDPPQGSRPLLRGARPLPGPSIGHDQHRKSIRVLASERRRADPTSSRAPRMRNVKLWGAKNEDPSGPPETADEHVAGATPAPFAWVHGDCIGQTEHGKLLLALGAASGELFVAKKCERDKEDRAQEYVRHLRALSRESEILKNLNHANIVEYLGFEETSRFAAVFFEYVPGGPLSDILREHGTLSEAVTRSFLGQTLGGLEYLRTKGVIHCNLTPENILLGVHGTCKLSNFTEARHVNEDIDFAGRIAPWRAPEIFDGTRFDCSADIWSVGCIAYEMFTGSCAWADGDVRIKQVPPPVPTGIQLSPTAEDFLNECFIINPHKRPSVSVLRGHLYLELPSDWSFNGL